MSGIDSIALSLLTNSDAADDDWGDAFATDANDQVPGGWESSAPALVVQPKPSVAAPSPHVLSTPRPTSAQSLSTSVPSRGVSPAPATPTTSTLGMSKEEKAAEMARRKEERKQVS